METLENKEGTVERDVTTTFLSGRTSCTLIISKEIAKKYGIDEPSHVIVEGTDQGILIRKLRLDTLLKQNVTALEGGTTDKAAILMKRKEPQT